MTTPTSLSSKYGFEYPFKPDPLIKKALPYIKRFRNVLDVGCGEGADSVFFVKEGFNVTALDNNNLYLTRLKAYLKDHNLSNIAIQGCNVLDYPYLQNHYEVINCLLVGCCMRRSEFEKLLTLLKNAVKPEGVIIMSLRNFLDPMMEELASLSGEIEPNTYYKNEGCCEIRYFIEKGRLKKLFKDFKILYYYEGMAPDKYEEIPEHGDSYIICSKM